VIFKCLAFKRSTQLQGLTIIKKVMKQILSLSVVILMLSSCSKNLVPYSGYLKEQHGWGEKEVERIQFYTSKDIVLYRDIAGSETKIENGSIKIKDGRKVEEIVIKAGTPGVAVWQGEDERYGISFDTSDNQFLTFGPNPDKRKRYYLMASEWDEKIGYVTYNDRKYKTNSQSTEAILLVDLKKMRKINVNSYTAKGRTVN